MYKESDSIIEFTHRPKAQDAIGYDLPEPSSEGVSDLSDSLVGDPLSRRKAIAYGAINSDFSRKDKDIRTFEHDPSLDAKRKNNLIQY
jgi:hypothetical protein